VNDRYGPPMPDWKARVQKEHSSDLESGETLREATFFQGRGTLAGQLTFGMVEGLGRTMSGKGSVAGQIGRRVAGPAGEAARKGYNTFEGSLAAQLPDDKGVVAVTDRRLLVFGYSQGVFRTRITDPVASIPLQDLHGWFYRPGKLAGVVDLIFSDGSTVGIEIGRANKPDRFAADLGIPSEVD